MLKKEDLIIDKFYQLKHEYDPRDIYFLFKGYNDSHIFCDGYQINYRNNEFEYYDTNSKNLCTLRWFKDVIIINEVYIEDIIKYFPKNHHELIKYRQNKINYLLYIDI